MHFALRLSSELHLVSHHSGNAFHGKCNAPLELKGLTLTTTFILPPPVGAIVPDLPDSLGCSVFSNHGKGVDILPASHLTRER